MKSEKRKFVVSGYVEVAYYTEIEASSPEEAIRIVKERNSDGLINWEGGTWESHIKDLRVYEEKKIVGRGILET